LYDVFVDDKRILMPSERLAPLLRISEADRNKYARLSNLRDQLRFEFQDETAFNEENTFSKFFAAENDRILDMLLDVSQSHDRRVTSSHLTSVGLDPVVDVFFVAELLECYGIEATLAIDIPCCPDFKLC